MQIKELLKKSIITIIDEGPKSFYIKAKNYLRNNEINIKDIALPATGYQIDDYIDTVFRNLQPIDNVIVSKGDHIRLNLVTDSIGKESLFGGVATAIIIASMFANKYDCELRIITRNSVSNPEDFFAVLDMNDIRHPDRCCFFSDCNRNEKGNSSYKLEIHENDIFFATSWWSAEAIRKTTLRKRFFYVIQEVETYFYPHGDEHLLCSKIMNNPDIDFIVNSHYLWEYFERQNNYICQNGCYFEPAFSKKLYSLSKNRAMNKKKKLFFYSRPDNPRNLFYFGIMALDEAIKQGIISTKEWDIYFVGQDVPNLIFNDGSQPIKLGVLSWKDYSKFLKTVDLTISLMYTPHPSYPPLDAACSGSVVLTNSYLNKDSFELNKNVILSSLNLDTFIKQLYKAVELSSDLDLRIENYNASKINRDWNKTLEKTLVFMKGCIENQC